MEIPPPLPGRASDGTHAGEIKQQAKSVVDRCGVGKHFGNIGIEKDDVGSFTVSLEMLSPHTLGKVVFGPHAVFSPGLYASFHIAVALGESLLGIDHPNFTTLAFGVGHHQQSSGRRPAHTG